MDLNYKIKFNLNSNRYKVPRNKIKFNKIKKIIKKIYNSTYGIRCFIYSMVNTINKKGNHERSILIFYNDEEHAIRLPINNFIIIFFVLIFFALVYTGYDAYNIQKHTREFYNTLSAREAKTYGLIEDYKNSLNRFYKVLIDYNNIIKSISYIIDYNDIGNFNNNIDNESQNINKVIDEVNSYQKNVLSFMNISQKVHKEIPLGWPVAGGGRISSGFGARLSPFNQEKSYHYGVDIAGTYGTPILAVADGTVSFSGWKSGYGWFIVINHNNGYQTAYGHNSKLLVDYGEKVKRGQKIALIGNTGRTTGIHCHFEVRILGDHQNPMSYLSSRL